MIETSCIAPAGLLRGPGLRGELARYGVSVGKKVARMGRVHEQVFAAHLVRGG